MQELSAPTDNARRDQWGRYKVVRPEGGRPVGYSRATTVAKALDDQSNLMNWGNRMTALGLAQRPDLLALVQAADPEDRKELDKVCERAKEAGGATARRDLGTALHTMVEKSHADPAWKVPATYAADVAAVNAEITAAGFEVVEGMSEVMVVLDRHEIAGTSDLTLRRLSDGRLFVADLKTGATVKYGALAWAIQLAVYAHADNIYRQGSATDGSEDERLPVPEVDREAAVILHVQPGSGACDMHWLDIARGAEALEVAMAVRTWRKEKALLTQFESGVSTPATPAPVTSTEGDAGTAPAGDPPVDAPTGPGEAADREAADGHDSTVLTSPGPANLHAERTAWLLRRIEVVKTHEAALSMLGSNLPADVPTPRSVRDGENTWSVEQIDAYAELLDRVESRHEIPFGEPDPAFLAAQTAARADAAEERRVAQLPTPQLRQPLDEGAELADPKDVAELRALLMTISNDPESAELANRLLTWSRDGARQGRPWNMGRPGKDGAPDEPTPLRRWAICASAIGVLDLVISDVTDFDVDVAVELDPEWAVRTALAMAIGEDLQPTWSTGAVLGSMTTDEAKRLGQIVDTHRLDVRPDGTPQLVAAA